MEARICCAALSQDKVTASKLPNTWNLRNIFIVGIVYGLYLTLSTWALFYVATHTSFFADKIGMHDLRYSPRSVLEEYCATSGIPLAGVQVCQLSHPHPSMCPRHHEVSTSGICLSSKIGTARR